ncbi:hypothetical protein F4678DRAFT_477918 [Xylaria arbuscula]|nr:hypothetical protein F4678DRAFT_477918 [Xylaria arbuscula]
MAPTFHPFRRLPAELRIQIWTLTAYPRIVQLRLLPETYEDFNVKPENVSYISHTPAPAVLHVCRESRQIAPYRKTFFTPTPAQIGIETKYIWPDIERLKFVVPKAGADGNWVTYYNYFWGRNDILGGFSTLREPHIAVKEPFFSWGFTAHGTIFGTCPRKNVRFIDLRTGLLLTCPQFDMAYEWGLLEGVKVHNVDDVDTEIRLDLRLFTGSCLQELRKMI